MEDIRIGNDICFDIDLNKFDWFENIGTILKIEGELLFKQANSCKAYSSMQHTLNACGQHSYNVLPTDAKERHFLMAPFVNFKKFKLKDVTEVVDGNIKMYFNAPDLVFCGIYRLVLKIVAEDSNWINQVHMFTIDFGDLFTLNTSETSNSGNIVIELPTEKVDPEVVYYTVYLYSLNMKGSAFSSLPEYEIASNFVSGEHDVTSKEQQFTYTTTGKLLVIAIPANIECPDVEYYTQLTNNYETVYSDSIKTLENNVTYGDKSYKVYYRYSGDDSLQYRLTFKI